MKKAIYQIRKTYLAPVVILIVMLAFLMVKGTKSAYKITLWEPEMTLTQTGQIEMVVTGGNLLRINSFYVDGERIEDCTVGKMNYNQCRVVFDPSVFSEENTWHEIRVGYNKWGVIDLLSTPIWVEWTGS
ncbi:MAG: hypothetical protein IJE71_10845 [Clostridia bacterium]|nr:hypothetical protein [Clostridia bacterium]